MTQFLLNLWSEQEGQNVPEFALLLFLVCLTAVSAMGGVATKVNSMYSNASTHVLAAANPVLTGGSAGYTTQAPPKKQTESKDAGKTKSAS